MHTFKFRPAVKKLSSWRCENIAAAVRLGLWFALLGVSGCGQSAQPLTPPVTNQVNTYFGSPFSVAGSNVGKSSSSFDHAANQVGVAALSSSQIPTEIMSGTFLSAATGFSGITENFGVVGSSSLTAENPPITGAWAVEIPGGGVLANLLTLQSAGGGPVTTTAAPAAMAENSACPNFSSPTPFLYVTTPKTGLTGDTGDYGLVNISAQGSDVTFDATPFLIGAAAGTASTVTGACSTTPFGSVTAYPINSFGAPSNLDLVAIGDSSFLVSSFSNSGSSGGGAFGGGTGVIGVAEPSQPVSVSALIALKYNGFVYAPLNNVRKTYDITVLASSFGNHTATSQECSALQSSLAANNGQGARSVAVLPSANTIYGGEFLKVSGTGEVNDPTGTSGSENCDMAIDLGAQDSATNGLFPNATVFIGSGFPAGSNPWICPQTGSACAVSFPAAAVVGLVKGQSVIFLAASASSTPAAQLPGNGGNFQSQPVGIYLFQKAQ
jgi:hypothetical protein